jgi:uncharacterized protein YbaA (DUF1428 family)
MISDPALKPRGVEAAMTADRGEMTMAYIDGFVIPVPSDKREDYRKLAEMAAAVYKEYGATRVAECWADDAPPGKVTSFPMSVKTSEDEVVVFSWIEWPSKAAREEGNAKVMADPRMNQPPANMPFDAQRMIYGGFEILTEA